MTFPEEKIPYGYTPIRWNPPRHRHFLSHEWMGAIFKIIYHLFKNKPNENPIK